MYVYIKVPNILKRKRSCLVSGRNLRCRALKEQRLAASTNLELFSGNDRLVFSLDITQDTKTIETAYLDPQGKLSEIFGR